jgi:hypothetical protein
VSRSESRILPVVLLRALGTSAEVQDHRGLAIRNGGGGDRICIALTASHIEGLLQNGDPLQIRVPSTFRTKFFNRATDH